MLQTREGLRIRAAIAGETINGGGLAHYTEDLDRLMRTFATGYQSLEGAPYKSPYSSRNGVLQRVRLHFASRVPTLFRTLRWFRRSRKAWPEAKSWSAHWRDLPNDVITILPHVVVHDKGELDDYYAAIAERKFVLVIHDLHPLHFPQEWTADDVQLLKSRYGLLTRAAERIIVHNDFTANDVCEKLGIDRERISVVLLAPFFNEKTFEASPDVDSIVLSRLKITKPYALWASSSTFIHKNHERLILAWRLLVDRGYKVRLVCTGGRAPHWAQVKNVIRRHGLESLVHFTGKIDDAPLASVLRGAHIAICPTLFEGGGPGPAAEAAIAGIPLTISDIPQCRELFNLRSDLCTFFDPYNPSAIADAAQEILENYDHAKKRAFVARAEYSKMRTRQSAAGAYWNSVEMTCSQNMHTA